MDKKKQELDRSYRADDQNQKYQFDLLVAQIREQALDSPTDQLLWLHTLNAFSIAIRAKMLETIKLGSLSPQQPLTLKEPSKLPKSVLDALSERYS